MKKILLITFLLLSVANYAYCELKLGVAKDKVHIRSDSTVMSASLGMLKKGEKVEIIGEKFEWYKIRVPRRFPCYASAEYLELLSKNKGEVTASNLNLRNKPSLEALVIGEVEEGAILEVLSKQGDWLKVKGHPHVSGWIHNQFLEPYEIKLTKIAKEKKKEEDTLSGLIKQLNNPDIQKKKAIHEKLIEMGPKIIPALEAKLGSADTYTTYSIISILTKLGNDNPKLVKYFTTKIDENYPLKAGVYLDVIQDIVKPEKKLAYYYLAKNNKLDADTIEKAKNYLYSGYTKKFESN